MKSSLKTALEKAHKGLHFMDAKGDETLMMFGTGMEGRFTARDLETLIYAAQEQPSLRDQFAGHVLGGMLLGYEPDGTELTDACADELAVDSYKIADAMLKARDA